MSHQAVSVKAEFLGGLDQIFGGVKSQKCSVPFSGDEAPTLAQLLTFITENLLVNPKDLDVFIQDGSVRPGILVLINDTDWELEDKEEYLLENGDIITFTSTLHGG